MLSEQHFKAFLARILVKSGKEGKTNVSYNVYYSWKKIAKKYDVLSARDYANWQYELWQLRGKPENFSEYFGNYEDLDMYDNVATSVPLVIADTVVPLKYEALITPVSDSVISAG